MPISFLNDVMVKLKEPCFYYQFLVFLFPNRISRLLLDCCIIGSLYLSLCISDVDQY